MKYAIIFAMAIPRIESTPDGRQRRSERSREANPRAPAARSADLSEQIASHKRSGNFRHARSPVEGPHEAWLRTRRAYRRRVQDHQNGEVSS